MKPSVSYHRPADPLKPPKPTLANIAHHINVWGWCATVVAAIIAVGITAAAFFRLVSPAFAALITVACAVFWYRVVFREAKYDAYGDLIMMTDNSFPDDLD